MKLYIIAHTWRDVDMTIQTFRSVKETLEALDQLTGDDFRKPDPSDTIDNYLNDYWEFIGDDTDNLDFNFEIKTIDLTTYVTEDVITSRLEEMGYQLPKKYSYFAPDGAWGIGVSQGEVYANNEEEAREKANEQVKADCEELNDKLGGHYLEWAGGTRNIEIEEIK